MKARYPELISQHGDLIRELSGAGKTIPQIREAVVSAGFPCVDGTVRKAMILMGVPRTGNKKGRKETIEKARLMGALYRNGYTLQQIGDQYGITRERVRQLITKYEGLRGKDGGYSAKAAKSKAERRQKAEARCYRKWGCTVEQYKRLLKMGREMTKAGESFQRTPTGAFARQRENSRKRGIGWELTLGQWWHIWEQSGKWEQRGRGQGYVMARVGDDGPYAVGNVYITTAIDNSSNAHRKRKHDLPTGVHLVRNGNYRAFVARRCIKGVVHHLGTFHKAEIAHAAYLAADPSQVAAE